MKSLVLIVLLGAAATAEAGVVDEVSAGSLTSCFRAGTNLYCSGDNTYHQIDAGSVQHYSVPIAMGRTVRDRSGRWAFEPYRVETVSVGANHVCAVFIDHKAYCWGRNTYGQLGNGSITDSAVPSLVLMPPDITAVVSLASGTTHTCAIFVRNSRKRAACWGRNNHAQLGFNGGVAYSAIPIETSIFPMDSIYTGHEFTCALGGNDPDAIVGSTTFVGRLMCWGRNDSGQLGFGISGADILGVNVVPLPAVRPNNASYYSRARAVAVGLDFICVVVTGTIDFTDGPFASGDVYCVGNDQFRQTGSTQSIVGSGTANAAVTAWTKQALPHDYAVFVASSATAKHACAVLATGDIWCWGANGYGQLGLNSAKAVPPNLTDGMAPATWRTGWGLTCQENNGVGGYPPGTPCQRGVAVGSLYTMLITTSKSLHVWGNNFWGQLGLGDTIDRWVPTPTGY
jgi:alpha-tubulin suppressor-like RCC1 family protein